MARKRINASPLVFWALNLCVWTIPGVLSVLVVSLFEGMNGPPVPLWRLALVEAAPWYTWALLSPMLFALAVRFPWGGRPRWHVLGSHAAALAVSACAFAAVAAYCNRTWGQGPPRAFPDLFVRAGLGWSPILIVVFSGILGVANGLNRSRQARAGEVREMALRVELARAHLAALQAQLHPHFFFNTLNTVTVLIQLDQGEKAIHVIGLLSDLLRRLLKQQDVPEVALSEELDWMASYLAIQQTRFPDHLRVRWDVDDAARAAMVPNLVLQPLVENAIRHGVSKSIHPTQVQISAHVAGPVLELSVVDQGPGFAPQLDPLSSPGVGLSNTLQRLKRLYGDSGRLSCRNGVEGGAQVSLQFPLRLAVRA